MGVLYQKVGMGARGEGRIDEVEACIKPRFSSEEAGTFQVVDTTKKGNRRMFSDFLRWRVGRGTPRSQICRPQAIDEARDLLGHVLREPREFQPGTIHGRFSPPSTPVKWLTEERATRAVTVMRRSSTGKVS